MNHRITESIDFIQSRIDYHTGLTAGELKENEVTSIREVLSQNPVILISADQPGCGSTSLAEALGREIKQVTGQEVITRFVGLEIRKIFGIKSEARFAEKLSEINGSADFDRQFYNGLSRGGVL